MSIVAIFAVNMNVEFFVYKWKLFKIAENMGISGIYFGDWREYEKGIDSKDEEEKVIEIIHVLFESNRDY